MVLYFDVLLLINLLMNYVILYFVALVLNLNRIHYRLFLGSILGCIFLLSVLSVKFFILQSFPIKVVISAVMILVSFQPRSFREFVKSLSFFYIISFMMGGGVLAFFYLLNIRQNQITNTLIINNISVPWWILLISALTLLLFLKYLWPFLYSILSKDTFLALMTIVIEDRHIEITGLIDTGNDLFDPVSNYPVIIVEFNAIKDIFSEDLQVILRKGLDESLEVLGETIANSSWANRFRIIPFESIGKSKGLMIGFKSDMVKIQHNNKTKITENAVVGIYQRALSPEGTYRALLNPILLNE
ncbi:MAG: sigma-E processing peptidase SpoIIGA [Thermoanaerobacteraceae bacterium]|nr:sigma-E processing peptidase SpoIIGA [Thermoanaerobacteraceae bacterium]